MMKTLFAAVLALSFGCGVTWETDPVLYPVIPPADAVMVEPGLYIHYVIEDGHHVRRYYRWWGNRGGTLRSMQYQHKR